MKLRSAVVLGILGLGAGVSGCQSAPKNAELEAPVEIESTAPFAFEAPEERTEPEPRPGHTRIAAIHFGGEDDAKIDWLANSGRLREAVAERVRKAARKGAKLIVVPEISYTQAAADAEGDSKVDIGDLVERVPGPTTRYFSRIARELKVYLHVPVLEIEPTTQRYYVTTVVLDDKGEIVGATRKMGLTRDERRHFIPGRRPMTYDSPWGKVAVLSAADLALPSLVKFLQSRSDVKVFAVSGGSELPPALSEKALERWVKLAHDRKGHLIVADSAALMGSGVFDPDGSSQSYHREIPGIAYGFLPKETADRGIASDKP